MAQGRVSEFERGVSPSRYSDAAERIAGALAVGVEQVVADPKAWG